MREAMARDRRRGPGGAVVRVLAAAGLAAAGAGIAGEGRAQDGAFNPGGGTVEGWEFVVAPYLILPSIDGTTSIGRVGGGISVDPGDILETLQFGGMFHAEARHRSGFGIAHDTSFMFLGSGASGPRGFTDLDVDIFQGIFEVYGTYRVDLGDTKLDPYAGGRIWHIDTEIDASLGPVSESFDGGDTWIDPVIGLRVQHRIAPAWRLQVQGDIGGFGIEGASEFTWNVMGGIAYDAWPSTSIFLL
ncbi:MAG: hypothetical protein AAFZ09_16585, partial [Pseudomonadota bacterium]